MIIDSHIHLPCNCDSIPEQQILREAEDSGINLLIVSDLGDWSPYPDEEIIQQANIRASTFANSSAGRALWLAYLNPQLKNWDKELVHSVQNSAAGVKLWISLKDSDGGLDNTLAVLKEAESLQLPVLLHVCNRTDGNLPGEISIIEFAKLAQEVPECVMIAGHFGGNWRYSQGILRNCGQNVYLDISGGYPEYGMLEALIASEGTDRILFGSDAPIRSFSSQLSKVLLADIGEAEREQILWKNSAKIFRAKNIVPVSKPAHNAYLNDINHLPDLTKDHFCFCGNRPSENLQCCTPAELEKLLELHDIREAYVGDLTGFFQLDLYGANRRFFKQCKGLSRVKPLAVINPRAHNWSGLLDFIYKTAFAGIVISPYIHHWELDTPESLAFFEACSEHKIGLWINCAISDYRFRHNAFNPRVVSCKEVKSFIRNAPDNRYVFQGLGLEILADALAECGDASKFRFDLSKLTDSQFALRNIIRKFCSRQLVLGSEFPFRHINQVRNSFLSLSCYE